MIINQILCRLKRLRHLVLHLQKRISETRSIFRRRLENIIDRIERLGENTSQLQSLVNQLRDQVRNITETEQNRFAFLQNQLRELDNQNAIVTISTQLGEITGTIEIVGEDFVAIREANNNIVIIHFREITSVSS